MLPLLNDEEMQITTDDIISQNAPLCPPKATEQEISTSLFSMPKGKSTGDDGIRIETLQSLPHYTSLPNSYLPSLPRPLLPFICLEKRSSGSYRKTWQGKLYLTEVILPYKLIARLR